MGLGFQVFQSRLGFFTRLESMTTDVVAFSVSRASVSRAFMSALAIESIGASTLLMLSVCAWVGIRTVIVSRTMASALRVVMCLSVFNVTCSMMYAVQRIHDALQLFFVVKQDGYLSLAFGRAGHLHLRLEELSQSVA